jgi:phage I-like protein
MNLINRLKIHGCSLLVRNAVGRWLLGLPNLRLEDEFCLENYDELITGVANEFKVLVDDWVKIFPYGDVEKDGPTDMRSGRRLDKKVLQRFNRESADRIVANFNSAKQKAGNDWPGRPWYVGHPDVPGLENTYPDKKAYGWIMSVEARGDGLYGQVKWSGSGRVMLDNAHYKFHSPFVLGPRIGVENGLEVYLPVWLESVGFTNTPNIRGTILLVNTRHDGPRDDRKKNPPSTGTEELMDKQLLERFRAMLKLPNTADENTVVARLEHVAKLGLANSALGDHLAKALQTLGKTAAELAAAAGIDESTVNNVIAGEIQTLPEETLGKVAAFLNQPVDELKKLVPAQDPAAVAVENDGLKTRVADLQTQFGAERSARVRLELDNLVREGRVTAAEVAFYNSELHVKFDDTLAQLRRRPANFGGRPQTGELGARKIAGHKTPAEQFTALVNEALPKFGNDWSAAWAAMRKDHPALFAELAAKK